MSKPAFLVGLAMVASADMGSGIILTYLLGKAFSLQVNWWVYGLGIFFALAPDVDVPLQKLLGGKIDSKHREITHYPIVVISLGILSAGLPGFLNDSPLFWPALAASCLFAHFLHDSIGEANRWGVKWLAPFSDNQYQLFMRKVPTEPMRLFCVWTPAELAKVKLHSLEDWLRDYYLKPTGESVASIVWLAIALMILAW